MKEIQEILREWHKPGNAHENMAIATLVKVQGSTYRRPGARMLILPDGRRIGALSGGCLESDVAERARQVMETGEPCLVQYNSKTGFDVVEEMGCRGALTILVERVSTPEASDALEFLEDCIEQRRIGVLATVFQVEGHSGIRIGQKLAYPESEIRCELGNAALCEALRTDTAEAAATKRSFVKTYSLPEGAVEVFLEFIQPPVSLTIFGAGDDAIPLARFASLLGWKTGVLDYRAAFATSERFPMADLLLQYRPDSEAETLPLDYRSAIVIMSHHYEHDRSFLSRLACSNVSYIGILGPVQRTERLKDDVRAAGIPLSDDFVARLHSPAGLDIGSETPEEIALSIISEIQATFTARTGGSLSNRTVPSESLRPGRS